MMMMMIFAIAQVAYGYHVIIIKYLYAAPENLMLLSASAIENSLLDAVRVQCVRVLGKSFKLESTLCPRKENFTVFWLCASYLHFLPNIGRNFKVRNKKSNQESGTAWRL